MDVKQPPNEMWEQLCHKCQRSSAEQAEVRPLAATCDWQCARAGAQAPTCLVKMGSWMQPGIKEEDVFWNWSVLGSNDSLPL